MQIPEHHHHHRHKNSHPEDYDKKSTFRRIESVVSRYILQVIGGIFILASIFYIANSSETIISVVKKLGTSENIITPQTLFSGNPAIASAETKKQEQFTGPMILWILVITAIIITGFILERRFRRKETGRLLVLAFYPVLIFLARNFGWQVHLLFPLVLFFSILLFRNGMKLRTTISLKVNVLLAWIFFGIWWFLKVAINGKEEMLFPSLLYSCIFFFWFFWTGINRGYAGYHKSTKYTEYIVILVNIGAFYLFTSMTFIKFGLTEWLWFFTLILSFFLFGSIYLSEKFKQQVNKEPILLGGIVLISLVLPLLFRMEVFLTFFGCLSVLLLLYGRYTGLKPPVILSLVSLLIMVSFFLESWILHFFPAVCFRDILSEPGMVKRSILAGLVAIPVLVADRVLLKKMKIDFSKKWFNRNSYLRLMKALILLTVYLTGFWIFCYFAMVVIKNNEIKLLSWFCFSCLYFIVVLPILSKQKSSFLRPLIWFALLNLMIYPGLIQFSVIDLRNESLRFSGYSSAGFLFHYVATALLISNLWLTGIYFTRFYKEKRSYLRGLWIFIVLIVIFLFYSEMDHLTIINGLKKGMSIEDMELRNFRLPLTTVLMVFTVVILCLGFFRKERFLRAMGLVLFALTLIKFIYLDVRYMSVTGKIVLLFSVGIVTLAVSLFYPKIRNYFHYRDSHHHHTHHRSTSDERSMTKQ